MTSFLLVGLQVEEEEMQHKKTWKLDEAEQSGTSEKRVGSTLRSERKFLSDLLAEALGNKSSSLLKSKEEDRYSLPQHRMDLMTTCREGSQTREL